MFTKRTKARLRTILCCSVLQMAALFGLPMRADEIQELMQSLARPKVARITPDESAKGEGPGSGDRDV